MKKIFVYLATITLTTTLFAGEFSVYEANYPGVKDYNINIDEATLVVHPRGNFIEMNLYMTISYDFESWFFKNYDELEFLWKFSLPEHAIMHEFWVWFGDSIMSAEVLDKWTAELLFSDVSSPVRNPGLLTQSKSNRDGQVAYQLRLFPIKRTEQKRFKIQFLLPGRPSVEALRTWLPTTQIISEKSKSIDKLRIIYKYHDSPFEPTIVGTNILSHKHCPEDSAWKIEIPLEFDQFVELLTPSPIKENFYFSALEYNGEYYYHLAVYPPEVTKSEKPRNILIAVDFNRLNTKELDGEFLLSYLKETIQQTFTESDSINIIIGYDEIVQGSEEWVSCTETNIDQLFSNVMRRSFPSYSYFQPLMSAAAKFINNQADSAEVLVITNTDEISLSTSDKDQLALEIVNMFKTGTKLHFIDLENKSGMIYNRQYYGGYSAGYYETQLQSFYGDMSYATEGNLYFLRYHSIKTILGAFFYEEISHFESVEVQMRFQDGYSHSKHLLALNEGYYPLHFPIMQVGKYSGSLPIEMNILGKIRMNKVESHLTITEDDVVPGTSQVITSWYGDHIRSLLNFPYSPVTVNEIINLSIEHRILTPYSGFLIYYPDENHGYCQDCIDETQLTDIEMQDTQLDSTVNLDAFPNPFNTTVSITVQIQVNKKCDLSIYNILGEKVCTLDLSNSSDGFNSTVHWNGQNDNGEIVSTGVYFAVIVGPKINKSVKLLFIQ